MHRPIQKINNLIHKEDIKLFAQNEKELETLIQAVRIYSQDIGMEFVIEKCAMCDVTQIIIPSRLSISYARDVEGSLALDTL